MTTRLHPLVIAAIVTIAVTGLSNWLPPEHAATGIALAFAGATALLVLRHDTGVIHHFGLSLSGVLEPEPLDLRRVAKGAAAAAAWATGLAVVVFPFFVVGFRAYWQPLPPFVFRPPPSWSNELLGQMLVVAVPEEAFYRGYLMTALDDLWPARWSIGGARLGLGWLVSSAIFAAGHYLTEPDPGRLAVLFPALLFGWLRARTGGIGAPALFHALCNLFSATLGRGYGLFGG